VKTTAFKNTDIGTIPEDWEVEEFGEAMSFLRNNTLPRACMSPCGDIANLHYGDVLIRYGSILDCSKESIPFVSEDSAKKAGNGFLVNGDIVIADTAEDETVGKTTEVVGLDGLKAVGGLHTIPCRPIQPFALGWLGYFTNSALFHDQLLPLVCGIKVSSISRGNIKGVYLLRPPLSEQRRIAAALSDADELVASLDKLIEKKKRVKEGAMQRLLSGETRLPGFTGKWVEKRLGDVCEIVMGQSPSSTYYNLQGNGLPLIQGNADMDNRTSIIRLYTSQITKTCEVGDIILSVRAPVGAVGKAGYKSCLGRGVCALKHNGDFLYQYLLFVEDKWGEFSKGSTFDSINSSELSDYKLTIPPSFTEQQTIAGVLSDMDAEIAALSRERAEAARIKQGMMQELLTGKVRLT